MTWIKHSSVTGTYDYSVLNLKDEIQLIIRKNSSILKNDVYDKIMAELDANNVRNAIKLFNELNCRKDEISIPEHIELWT